MAKENIAFMVNLRKNTVPDSDMFGRYYPEAESKETLSTKGEEITSKKFKDQCSLQFAYLVETIKKVIGGKEKSYTLRTPLSAWGIVDAEADTEGGSDNQGSGSFDTGGGNSSTIPGEGD